jgi:L-cysteine:1D-myo-inositol 2-amino-2-deoxy-alpha-D-glucopyranoside ligase
MQSWPAPSLPPLPGTGRAPRLYDTAAGEVVEVAPSDGPARMYVCGITPYDATHLGHAATYLTFDLIVRLWRDAGHETSYTQNVTDVDDPLLERAQATGEDWVALAERETQLFRDDMAALRILPPDAYAGAVESIPPIVDMIETLRREGAVYDVDGDLYFAVKSDPDFGRVSGYDEATMRALFAERGGDPASATRWTACCGSPNGRGSRPGTHRSAAAGPAGTSSARRSRCGTWA